MRCSPLVCLFLLHALLALGCGRSGPSDEALARAIQHQMLEDHYAQLIGVSGESERGELTRFYEARAFSPAWVGRNRPREEMDEAFAAFCNAAQEGLRPSDYATQKLATALDEAIENPAEDDSLRAVRLAQLDVLLTHAYLGYASDLLTGRVDPRLVGSGWNAPIHQVDVVSLLSDSANGEGRFDFQEELAERHEGYNRLRRALQRYRQIEAAGGWPTVPEGEALEVGDQGGRVAAIRKRLAVTGELPRPDSTSLGVRFDSSLAEAVRRFQDRHGLKPDGVVGEDVVRAMNVSAGERRRQIELNLERWRWIPSFLSRRYVYVNIPAFQLHAFEAGKEVLNMRVVVGKEYEDRATPVFSDTMQYVVFRPYWNVPQSIAEEEIVPAARRNRGYLARNNYEIVSSWDQSARVLNPATVDLDLVDNGTYRIRQKPGGSNALGNIKFMFPNEYNIYLHHTPAEYLFERAERAYSHGCIRVEDPVALADYVFTDPEMTKDEIRRRMEHSESETVNLDEPIPVYILYWTAFVDADGEVNFRKDLYGQDEALARALAAKAPADAASPACAALNPNGP